MSQDLFCSLTIEYTRVDEPPSVHSIAEVMTCESSSDSVDGGEQRAEGGDSKSPPSLDTGAHRQCVGTGNVEDSLLMAMTGGAEGFHCVIDAHQIDHWIEARRLKTNGALQVVKEL